MVFDETLFGEHYKYADAAEVCTVRNYVLHTVLPDKHTDFLDRQYAVAVAVCAAAERRQSLIKRFFPEAEYVFDALGHIVVIGEFDGIKQAAARAASELTVFFVWNENVEGRALPDMFSAVCELAPYSFYAGMAVNYNTLINRTKIAPLSDEKRIERMYRTESYDRLKILCDRYFLDLAQTLPEPQSSKREIARLIRSLLQGASEGLMREVAYELATGGAEHFHECSELCQSIIERIRREHGEDKKLSPLIADTLEIIERNLSNEELSLRWIAQEVLFTNADYLGKLFKKEIGDNFTGYVKRMRMELAKKMILNGKRDRIYEVAEKVGFGTNSQYFSQVFKKYTGVSPLEYKSVMQHSETVNNLYDIQMGENV